MKSFLRISAISFLLWLLIHTIYIVLDSLFSKPLKSDCILILGNQVNKDGTLSHRLQSRVEKGYELFAKGYAPTIIVSGGLGKEGYIEAVEMKKYLSKKGVSEKSIITDTLARTTLETMENFIPIANKHKITSVIIVSQYYHLTRSKTMLRNVGVNSISTAASNYFEWTDLYELLREFVKFYGYCIIRIFS